MSAGSRAGAYLAITGASVASVKPNALLLLYGMLDPLSERSTTPGTNIFGMPPIDGQPFLDQLDQRRQTGESKVLSGYPAPSDPTTDFRMGLIATFHCMALFPDFMAWIQGLYPVYFSGGSGLPTTIILHGKNDNAVPFQANEVAAGARRSLGVDVHTDFAGDASHSFDAMAGNVDIEDPDTPVILPALNSLKRIIELLDQAVLPLCII
ncbi:hypothetical protein BDV34DRAFT_221663 [Aspergillus parasiticus]|uniref:Alpha/Beta hydrolase protein n=1 Tax=Aspergillus parasiticus TaxID=5067 RepID=A0A5N6DVL7_ASPPA|nr:hypothetical protein BDV34DRAFT_221663 [Aspergillus parasiticus]